MTQIFNSTFGPLEYSDTGSGEVILAIHGAMGGWDQSEILAKTVAPDGYRVIAVSRPGYLGTPLKCAELLRRIRQISIANSLIISMCCAVRLLQYPEAATVQFISLTDMLRCAGL